MPVPPPSAADVARPDAPRSAFGDAVGEPVASLLTDPAADYRDDHWVRRTGQQPPLWWAEQAFAPTKPLARWLVFDALLGLGRAQPGPAGWRVDHADEHAVRLVRAGRRNRGTLLFACTDDEVHMALELVHLTPLGRALWRMLAGRHRAMAAALLPLAQEAARRDRLRASRSGRA